MAIEVTAGLEVGLGEIERNAFEVLINLTDLRFNQVKDALGLPTPNKLGPQTLATFVARAKGKLDLSDAGINHFKDQHGLGNTGALKGVIGRQTASEIVDQILPAPEPNDRKINPAGLALVKEFEGLERKIPSRPGFVIAYRDIVNVLTIGYGHTSGVRVGQVISFAEAEDLLRLDLAEAEDGVTQLVRVPISDNQFAALVSFAFNLGVASLAGSTLLRKVNAGDTAAAANEFLKWANAGGHPSAGLLRRRKAERALFLS